VSATLPEKHGTVPALPVGGRRKARGGALVLPEELFAHLLVRERKRSERSGRPFILLTIRAKSRLARAAVQALAATTRETDIVGWVASPSVLGAIFPEIGAAEPARAVETIRARFQRELRRRLEARAAEGLTVELSVYPESRRDDAPSGPGPADPAFHPDLFSRRTRRRVSDWIKRALDVASSLALLLLLSPVLLVAAALVRLTSPGPILFRQERIGQMSRPFRMLKFRTMYVNAGENPHQEFIGRFIKERAPTTFKLENDPRITPVGRVLRKTSLDELPQLWNVLVGEMSLVGPRPPLPYELEHYSTWHRRRILEAKPGITGLWQVTGRSRTTFDEMVRLDLRYARTRSLWTDLGILLRTPGAVVSGKGAR
jgi:lipopolysaccharide/colanic/teichoic acid biosynthesis glycosyltransferase